jgi:hypothetical protein
MSRPVLCSDRRRPASRAARWLPAAVAIMSLHACGDALSDAPQSAPRASTESALGVDPPPASETDPGGDPRWFVDVTAAARLDFVHVAGLTPEKRLAETMGAGAVLADLDGDGDLDAYLVQSGPLPLFARDPGLTNRLFVNDGTGRFRDATARSGAAADPSYGMGATAADVDLDGDLDLALTNLGADLLLLNDGSGAFIDDTARAGIGDPRWTGGATFFDADADGDPDLYVVAYVDAELADPPWCGRREPGWRSACHPDTYPGLADRFWLNLGDGRFTDATADAGLATEPGRHGKGLGVLAIDVDGDLDLDLYIANDSVENRLWLNRGDAHFDDGTLFSGTGVNDRGLTEAGMGLAAGDVDDDGDPDLFVTNFDNESNTLYRNDGAGLFVDVTSRAGLDASSRLPVGFGTVMADFDHDGLLDLAVTNGHIIDNIQLYHDGKRHAQQALLFAGRGAGQFEDVSSRAGDLTSSALVGRGLYGGDLDGDGDLDLLLTTCGAAARVYRNQGGPGGRSAGSGLVLEGLDAGSRVRLQLVSGRVLHRWAGGQPSYFGMGSPGLHVGLGDDALKRVEITGLDGQIRAWSFDPPATAGTWRLRSTAESSQFVSSSPGAEPLVAHPDSGDAQR